MAESERKRQSLEQEIKTASVGREKSVRRLWTPCPDYGGVLNCCRTRERSS